ncbi:MAG TPA: hypothetical protein VLF66_08485 [Thermoanaerobaculia bacterium]|nr:hypothetical protein [Thermoanaerobaculia bacterium]
MTDEPSKLRGPGTEDWKAGWEDQEANRLEASLAATPAQRLAWLEEAIELAWATGALPSEAGWEQTESRKQE